MATACRGRPKTEFVEQESSPKYKRVDGKEWPFKRVGPAEFVAGKRPTELPIGKENKCGDADDQRKVEAEDPPGKEP